LSPDAELFTLDYQPEPAKSIDHNPLQSKWFWVANGLLALLSIFGYVRIRKRRHFLNSPEYAQIQIAKAEYKSALKTARDAINRSDTDAYFRTAQNLIRLQLSIRTGRNLQAAGTSEILVLLECTRLSESAQKELQALCKQADSHRFSGKGISAITRSDMESSFQMLTQHLKALK
jgi:hypothetical protein